MEKRTRTEITFETDRTFVITRRARPQISCGDCPWPSKMLTTEEAVHASGLTSRAVYRALETGKVHFVETPAGLTLFCLNSISLLRNARVPTSTATRTSRLEPTHEFERSPETCQIPERTNVADVRVSDGAGLLAVIRDKNSLPGPQKQKTRWVLTPEAFEKLLDRLDENREHAGETYEKIRRRMMKFFACRQCASPEELADETIDRVARRISEGREIWTSNPASYFYGVARNVLNEYLDSVRQTLPLECLPARAEPREQPALEEETEWTVEVMLEALEHCMSALSPDNRELILNYYQGDGRRKIRNRQDIAQRLQIQPNALRIRVHRIRERLEHNVRQYLRENMK